MNARIRDTYLIVLSLLAAGCASVPKQTALMKEFGATDMTAAELRFRLHDFAIRYPGVIEQTALEIDTDNTDPLIGQNLVRWQFYGIPAYLRTLFYPDPYLSLVDSYVLTEQIIDYYERGLGKDDFGEYQDRVLATYRDFEAELRQLGEGARGRPVDEARVQEWVDDYPIKSYLLVRRSVLPLAAEMMGRSSGGLGGAVASVEGGLQDMNTRMTMLTDFIPKQVQWQMELVSADLLGGVDTKATLDSLLNVTGYIGLVDTLIAKHVTLALTAIDEERAAVLGAVTEERRAVLEAVASERALILAAIASERATVLADAERIVAGSLEEVKATAGTAIDRMFRAGLLLVLAVFVAAVVYRFISVRMLSPRRA